MLPVRAPRPTEVEFSIRADPDDEEIRIGVLARTGEGRGFVRRVASAELTRSAALSGAIPTPGPCRKSRRRLSGCFRLLRDEDVVHFDHQQVAFLHLDAWLPVDRLLVRRVIQLQINELTICAWGKWTPDRADGSSSY
jgi:hypothetical protein